MTNVSDKSCRENRNIHFFPLQNFSEILSFSYSIVTTGMRKIHAGTPYSHCRRIAKQETLFTEQLSQS